MAWQRRRSCLQAFSRWSRGRAARSWLGVAGRAQQAHLKASSWCLQLYQNSGNPCTKSSSGLPLPLLVRTACSLQHYLGSRPGVRAALRRLTSSRRKGLMLRALSSLAGQNQLELARTALHVSLQQGGAAHGRRRAPA